MAADAEPATGLCSGQRMWGEENKNGRRDWNTDDGMPTLSVPAQIPPEFKAFVGCQDGAGSLLVPQMKPLSWGDPWLVLRG